MIMIKSLFRGKELVLDNVVANVLFIAAIPWTTRPDLNKWLFLFMLSLDSRTSIVLGVRVGTNAMPKNQSCELWYVDMRIQNILITLDRRTYTRW